MDKNLPRWIFQSVAEHFRLVAEDISLSYFVEGIDERSEETMQSNHVEARVSGPSMKEISNGYYNVDVVINFLFTKAMDPVDNNAYDLIQWTGVFADEMLLPIPIYKKGTGADDNGLLLGCLQIGKGKNEMARIYHFGQLDKDTPVRQSELDAVFHMDYTGREIGSGRILPEEEVISVLALTSSAVPILLQVISETATSTLSFVSTAIYVESKTTGDLLSLVSDATASLESTQVLESDLGVSDSVGANLEHPFVSTWNSSQTSAGSSNTYQAALPLISGGNYDFTVLWGDGNQDTITDYADAAKLHTYVSPGIYDITIKGQLEGWRFQDAGDKLKIGNVSNWGTLDLANTGYNFQGCIYLTSNSTETLNLVDDTTISYAFNSCTLFNPPDAVNWSTTNIVDFSYLFQDCVNFNQDVGSWDTSTGASFFLMFFGCTAFDQDLSSWNTANATNTSYMFEACPVLDQDFSTWNIEKVTTMDRMFKDDTLSTANYDTTLIGWEAQSVKDGVIFHGGNSKYSAGTANAARESLINTSNWVITDGGLAP